MERYNNVEQDQSARTKKNQDLYEDIYSNTFSSSNVTLLDNANEIDISKIQELVQNREGYNRIKEFKSVLKTPSAEEDKENYDIYEDIDNKIYDINTILEEAKAKRGVSEREKYRNLKNTQYNILTKLNLNEEEEKEEMVTDFFTQDKTIKDLLVTLDEDKNKDLQAKTSLDLFENLKGNNTVLTEPISEEAKKINVNSPEENDTFYTSHLNFTKEDFEDFQNLHNTVKKNNTLIKVLISILILVLLTVIGFLVYSII
jgi:hypothetical protein